MDGRKLPLENAYKDNTSASLSTPRWMGWDADVFNTSPFIDLVKKQTKKWKFRGIVYSFFNFCFKINLWLKLKISLWDTKMEKV